MAFWVTNLMEFIMLKLYKFLYVLKSSITGVHKDI